MKDNGFHERLNLALDYQGFPPKNRGRIQLLADMVGLTHRGASKWVNGESCPPAKKYADLAQKLNVNELWLKIGKGPMHDIELQSLTASSSVFTKKPREIPIYHHSHLLSSEAIRQMTVYCYLPSEGDYFGFILESEAMAPRFPTGSLLIVDRHSAIKDGDFVLVDHSGYPEPLFRQALITKHATYLMATNPKFDRLVLSSQDKIVGRIAQSICIFD